SRGGAAVVPQQPAQALLADHVPGPSTASAPGGSGSPIGTLPHPEQRTSRTSSASRAAPAPAPPLPNRSNGKQTTAALIRPPRLVVAGRGRRRGQSAGTEARAARAHSASRTPATSSQCQSFHWTSPKSRRREPSTPTTTSRAGHAA